MADPSQPPEQDAAPIDAEFEPVEVSTPEIGLAVTPGWVAFCLLGLVSLTSLGLALAAMGLFGSQGTPSSSVVDDPALRSQVQAAITRMEAVEARLATLTATVDARMTSQTTNTEAMDALSVRLNVVEEALTRLETLSAENGFDGAAGAPSLLSGRLENIETGLSRLQEEQQAASSRAVGGEALDALQSELTALRSELSDLRTSEADTDRKQAAALALMTVNGEAARGRPFLLGYQQLRAALQDDRRVLALEPYAARGVPTLDQLETAFANLEQVALEAESRAEEIEPGWIDQLFGDSVRVRRTSTTPLSQTLATAHSALKEGETETALTVLEQLPPDQLGVFADWIDKARARITLNETLDSLRLMVMSRGQP